MSIDLMHYNFKLRLNKIASNLNPNLNSAEIDEYLNIAIRQFVEEVYQRVESTQQLMDMLSTLVVKTPENESAQTPVLVQTGVYKFDLENLAENYLHLLQVKTNIVECEGVETTTTIVNHNELQNKLSSEMYKPSSKWRTTLGTLGREASGTTSLYVYTDGFTIDELYITYVKMPAEVALSNYDDIDGSPKTKTECDIHEMYHDMIVDMAVQKAAQNLLLNTQQNSN